MSTTDPKGRRRRGKIDARARDPQVRCRPMPQACTLAMMLAAPPEQTVIGVVANVTLKWRSRRRCLR